MDGRAGVDGWAQLFITWSRAGVRRPAGLSVWILGGTVEARTMGRGGGVRRMSFGLPWTAVRYGWTQIFAAVRVAWAEWYEEGGRLLRAPAWESQGERMKPR